MTAQRHDDGFFQSEVKDTYRAAARLRVYAVWSAWVGILLAVGVIGAMAFVWTLVAMIWGTTKVDEGVLFLAATALGTIVPAAGLLAASYRTSLGAARLERSIEGI